MYKSLIVLVFFISINLYANSSAFNLIYHGKLQELKKAFVSKEMNINTKCEDEPLIACAVKFEQSEIIDFLLSQGIDIHYKDNNGDSLLHIAAYHDNLKFIKYLVSKGIPLDIKKYF